MIGRILCRLGLHSVETVAEFSDGSWRKECRRERCLWYDYHRARGTPNGAREEP